MPVPAPSFVQVRIARPTDRLGEVVAFYRDMLGLPQIGSFDSHAGYTGVMLGLPDGGHHLEFTTHEDGSPCPAPTADNLMVLYFHDVSAHREVVDRMARAGHEPVVSENPYWSDCGGVTLQDPDGWRVVLVPTTAFRSDSSAPQGN